MPKIIIKKPVKYVQLHIVKARKIIDEHLPSHYLHLVLAKLPDDVTKHMVHNVKKNYSNRLDILEAMVEVAEENKKAKKDFMKRVSKKN